jgi:hypothetical protein
VDPEEIGSRLQRDDPLCSSGTAQVKSRQEKSDQKRRCSRSPYRTDARERRRVDPEGNTGIKDPGARRQLRLRNEETAGRISWKTHEKMFGLEIVKRIAGSPVPLQKGKVWTLWRGRPPPKRKKGPHTE